MGKFKEIIDIEKKNLPEYQYNFLYHRVMPGFIFILGGAIVALGLGSALYFIFHSELIFFIPLILWGIATIVLLILFVIYSRKYSIMLIDDKAKEFDKIYKLVDYDTAITKLKENKTIIDDTIFVGKSIYSFKDVNMFFFSKTLSGVYYFRIYIYNKNDNQFITYLELDKNLLSYFYNNLHLISNYELFELFVTDKKRFLKYLYKYNDINKMHIKYLKESSLSFDQEKH